MKSFFYLSVFWSTIMKVYVCVICECVMLLSMIIVSKWGQCLLKCSLSIDYFLMSLEGTFYHLTEGWVLKKLLQQRGVVEGCLEAGYLVSIDMAGNELLAGLSVEEC